MNFIVGFFLPALIGTINRNISNPTARFWASTVVCVLVGSIVNFIEHNGLPGYTQLTLLEITNSFAESSMFMIGAVKLSFESFWNNDQISRVVPNAVLNDESPLEKLNLKNLK